MKLTKIGLCGSNGRMGKAIQSLVQTSKNNIDLTNKLTRDFTEIDLQKLCSNSDVIIDFSHISILEMILNQAKKFNTPILIGTTGLTKHHFDLINNMANNIPILYASNTSLGANLIANLSAIAASLLNDYDIEIIESHHKYKKDAPSGTALSIGKEIAQAKQINFEKHAIFNRNLSGIRRSDDISFASIRGGGIFGEHQVIFAGENELIKIEHQALSRSSFAEGALIAAKWLIDKKPGLYSMKNLFQLK